jgi:hypothetical protein
MAVGFKQASQKSNVSFDSVLGSIGKKCNADIDFLRLKLTIHEFFKGSY